MKTITPSQIMANERKWYIIDAKDKTLWRLATQLATILKWKNKVSFVPHLDNWDYVIVTNCDKFKVTGNKKQNKLYYRHTGYLGGLKEISLGDLLIKKPAKPLEFAIKWMLPKNKLRAGMLERLKLFVWDEHTYTAQKPELIK
jgi:large subunit ribosomal protein L13